MEYLVDSGGLVVRSAGEVERRWRVLGYGGHVLIPCRF
jgi:hypothetical protein